MLQWCSIEDAASEVERKAMAVEGGGVQAERLQRSIIELRKVSVHTPFPWQISITWTDSA